jgi:hypothetical protein
MVLELSMQKSSLTCLRAEQLIIDNSIIARTNKGTRTLWLQCRICCCYLGMELAWKVVLTSQENSKYSQVHTSQND